MGGASILNKERAAEYKWVSMSWDRDSGQRYVRDGAS